MATDISLWLEYHAPAGWQPAVDVACRIPGARIVRDSLQVCWWPARWEITSLFFGPAALWPFKPGLPDDLSQPLSEMIHENFKLDSTYAGWISVEDLELATWPQRFVILGCSVPARYAHLFWKGDQPAPLDQLRSLGLAEPVLDQLTQGNQRRKSEYRRLDPQSFHLLPPDVAVSVTWIEPVSEFAGEIWTAGLSALVHLEEPHRYRLVTSIG